MVQDRALPALAELSEEYRQMEMDRFVVLKPHLEDGVPLTQAAAAAGVPVRTAQRWLERFRVNGLVGLARTIRRDVGQSRFPAELITLIEGMGLRKPPASAATIYRRVCVAAEAMGWPSPSYAMVYGTLAKLDPGVVMLAHDGAAAFRDHYELVHRHRAAAPNAVWQADHTMLDVLIVDEKGKPARPWLTTVIDDHSRAVAGYMVFVGAPSAINICLALRQAIWRKTDPAWPICGVPDCLYVDHGSDFTSRHLEQVAASLKLEIVYSTVARPQGRGKIERLFGTFNTELLPELPGHVVAGKPVTPPTLSLAQLDQAIRAFITGIYHHRVHSGTGSTPLDAWRGQGFIPRLPQTLDDLDLLLLHAAARRIHRDGVRFQGLRYMSPTLAGFVGEPVAVRYDPRDLSEVRLFHRNAFLCRAVSEEHAGTAITLQDIEAARRAHRQRVRAAINDRVSRVAHYFPRPDEAHDPPRRAEPKRAKTRLRLYMEDDR